MERDISMLIFNEWSGGKRARKLKLREIERERERERERD